MSELFVFEVTAVGAQEVNLACNGVPVEGPGLSVLLKYRIMSKYGTVPNASGKGKSPTKYVVKQSPAVDFDISKTSDDDT